MKKITKIIVSSFISLCLAGSLFAGSFNQNLTEEELKTIESGKVLIKKINYSKYICLNSGLFPEGDKLIQLYKDLNPKYLAEVIQIKPVQGNEDLPERLNEILSNISDYAGIPYFSERHQCYFDLYSSAKIVSESGTENKKEYIAEIEMEPFGTVNQKIDIESNGDVLLYDSVNLNKLSYLEKFDCVYPKKMKMTILLFREGENWVLYGIGGVNAPRIPFFTERIDTSFINRIKTFCNYIFEKL